MHEVINSACTGGRLIVNLRAGLMHALSLWGWRDTSTRFLVPSMRYMGQRSALRKRFPAILGPPDEQAILRYACPHFLGVRIEGSDAIVLGQVPLEHVVEAPADDGCVLAAQLGGPEERPQHPSVQPHYDVLHARIPGLRVPHRQNNLHNRQKTQVLKSSILRVISGFVS